jgi:hypothetical protein
MMRMVAAMSPHSRSNAGFTWRSFSATRSWSKPVTFWWVSDCTLAPRPYADRRSRGSSSYEVTR